MNWERHDRIFLLGAPLAAIPAVAFLPAFASIFLRPLLALTPLPTHARYLAILFPVLVFFQILGSVLIGFAGFRSRLTYITLLAMATSVFLFVVSTYTGLFLALAAGPN